MEYEADRDHDNEPSIAEMTTKAIEILSKNTKGFFLLVEGNTYTTSVYIYLCLVFLTTLVYVIKTVNHSF